MKKLFILTIILFTVQFPAPIFGQAQQKPRLVVQTGHFSYIKGCDISPDGRFVANISNDSIKLWELNTGREIWTSHEIKKPLDVVFSPNSRLLAVANLYAVGIWNLASGKFLGGFNLKGNYYNTISFSSDSVRLLIGNSNGITEWNLLNGQQIRELKTSEHSQAGTFSLDGKYFVSLFENKDSNSQSIKTARIYDLTSLKETYSFSVNYNRWDPLFQLKIVDINIKKRIIAVATNKKSVDIFELDTGNLINSINLSQDTSSISINNEGTQIAIVDSITVNQKSFSRVTVTDINSRELLFDEKEERGIFCIRFSRYGNLLVLGGESKTSKVWNVANRQLVSQFTPKASRITASTISDDGRLFATGSWNGRINIWDILTGRVIKSFFADDSGINSLEFNLKADKIISGGVDKTVRVWSLENTNSEIFKQDEIVETVSLSKDEKVLAICNHHEVILWDVLKQEILKKIQDLDKNGLRNSVENCKFSPDGNLLAVKFFISKINLYDTKTWLEIKTLPEILGKYVEFSPDGKILAGINAPVEETSSKYFLDLININDWNKKSINLNIKSYATLDLAPFAFTPDNEHIVTTLSTGIIKLWNIKTGTEIWSVPAHSNGILSLTFSKDGKYLFSGSIDMKTSVWNIKNGQKVCDLVVLNEKDWIVTTPDGKFDTNKLENPQGLHWIMPDAPFTPLSFEVFMRDYYEPKLLPRLLKCSEAANCNQEFKPIRDLSSLNRTQPKIEIKEIKKTASSDTVEIIVEAENVISEFQKGADKKALSSGIFDLRLFRDGQMVGNSTTDENLEKTFRTYKDFDEELKVWREANRVDLKDGKKIFSFRVKLPNDAAGKPIEFSAYAFNDDRVKSETSRKTFTLAKDTALKPKPRKAYVITFGVNKYDNAGWDLQFAGNDARAMREIVSAKLRSRKEFSEVIEIPLISDDETVSGKRVEKRDATKGNVKTALDLLSGKTVSGESLKNLEKAVGAATLAKINRANPDDMILMSFSSHGYADRNGIFYILPTDIGKNSGRKVTDELLRSSISSDELSLWLRDVDAGEMVMIVDACYAASAVEGKDFKPAPMGSRGLGQLAFDKGMKILTATQAANAAIESGGAIGHGLLTYALLREGLDNSQADFKAKDKTINLKEWLEYGEFEVPKLYEKLAAGELKGIGRGTEIVNLNGGGKDQNSLQTPTLFDFTRKKQEMILVQLLK